MNKWLLFYSIQYALFRFAYVHAISQKKPRPQPEIPESLVVQIKETIIVFKTGKFLLLSIIENEIISHKSDCCKSSQLSSPGNADELPLGKFPAQW